MCCEWRWTRRHTLLNSIQMHRHFFSLSPSVPQKKKRKKKECRGRSSHNWGRLSSSLLLGLLWGAACWDWGCNEWAATPRWGCICCPKTVRQWLNEWGPGCHCNAQGQLPLHSSLRRGGRSGSGEWETRGEKASAIQPLLGAASLPLFFRRSPGRTDKRTEAWLAPEFAARLFVLTRGRGPQNGETEAMAASLGCRIHGESEPLNKGFAGLTLAWSV